MEKDLQSTKQDKFGLFGLLKGRPVEVEMGKTRKRRQRDADQPPSAFRLPLIPRSHPAHDSDALTCHFLPGICF